MVAQMVLALVAVVAQGENGTAGGGSSVGVPPSLRGSSMDRRAASSSSSVSRLAWAAKFAEKQLLKTFSGADSTARLISQCLERNSTQASPYLFTHRFCFLGLSQLLAQAQSAWKLNDLDGLGRRTHEEMRSWVSGLPQTFPRQGLVRKTSESLSFQPPSTWRPRQRPAALKEAKFVLYGLCK